MPDTTRHLLLRVGVKLMFLTALAFSAYVLLSSTGDPSPRQAMAPPALRLDLTASTSPFQRIPWAGGNLILLRRSPAVLEQLGRHDELLLEPTLPKHNLNQAFFLAYDRGGELGCPLQWLAPGNVREAPLNPWPGGFRDSCGGSWYDAAGRVFRGQAARRNLASPDYRIAAGLLEVGPSSDNAAPLK